MRLVTLPRRAGKDRNGQRRPDREDKGTLGSGSGAGRGGAMRPCIGFHMQALVKLGASRQELEKPSELPSTCGGCPSLMYAANAIAAFDEFSSTTILSARRYCFRAEEERDDVRLDTLSPVAEPAGRPAGMIERA